MIRKKKKKTKCGAAANRTPDLFYITMMIVLKKHYTTKPQPLNARKVVTNVIYNVMIAKLMDIFQRMSKMS